MKWDKITENVGLEVYNRIRNNDYMIGGDMGVAMMLSHINGTHKQSRQLKQEIADDLYKVAKGWDIRNYKSLLNMFPKCFPVFARSGNVIIEYTDNGFEILELES